MIGYGSVDKPYTEHPAEPIREVRWAGGLAVKWKADTYVHAGGLTAALNSPTGTLSVWLKYNLDLAAYRELTLIDGNLVAYRLRHAPGDMTGHGSGDMSVDFAPGDPLDMRPVSLRFDLAMVNEPGVYSVDSTIYDFNFEGSMVSDGIVFGALNKWWHVYCEWNTQTGAFLLKVNGQTVASAALPGTTVGTESDGIFGFDVPWHQQPDMMGQEYRRANQNTVFFWWDQVPFGEWASAPTPYSVAEFWLDPGRTGVGVDKFVDTTTGRPKSLGANGELPLVGLPEIVPGQTKPAFYFHRAGAPKTILENRGHAGAFTLAKTIAEGSGFMELVRVPLDPDTDGPLDEPDAPHFDPPTG